jgi:hypothetical protein
LGSAIIALSIKSDKLGDCFTPYPFSTGVFLPTLTHPTEVILLSVFLGEKGAFTPFGGGKRGFNTIGGIRRG